MGPFGGTMIHAILPEVGRGLDTTVAGASTGITAYMIPFATLLVFSGALGHRWGLERTVRLALVLNALGAIVCILAPSLSLFLVGRAVQGAGAAFTSPLLVTLLIRSVPVERRGRALAAYASAQAAGQAFAPLVGGLSAVWSYRIAFAVVAAVALALCFLIRSDPADAPERGSRAAAGAGPARTGGPGLLARAMAVAALGQLAASAVMIVGGIVGDERFGLDPLQRGLVVSGFGLGGIVFGTLLGRLADRYGTTRLGPPFILLVGVAASLTVVAPTLAVLIVLVVAGGVAATVFRMVIQAMALEVGGRLESSAMSLVMAAQFLGMAVVPLVLVDLIGSAAIEASLLAGIGVLGALLSLHRRPRPDRQGGHDS